MPVNIDSPGGYEDAIRFQPETGGDTSLADRALAVRFYTTEVVDELLSKGGIVDRREPKIARARELGLHVSDPDLTGVVEITGAGRPIYRTVECVEIRIPGNRDEVVDGPCDGMSPDPRERFPQAYAKFKARMASQVVGTLLREWGMMPRTRALEFEALGVQTVEQLAGLSDQVLQQREFFGCKAERQKAQDFLAMSANMAPLDQARAEIDELKSQLRAQQEMIEEMRALIPKRKKRDEPEE